MIPEDEGEQYAGFEVYRDGDKLRASNADKDQFITRETFRTEYVARIRNP